MFGLASGLYQTYFAAPQIQILIVGESGVGKTALLERLKVTHFGHKKGGSGGTGGGSGGGGTNNTAERPREPLPLRALGIRPHGSRLSSSMSASSTMSDGGSDPLATVTPTSLPRGIRAVPGHLKLQATPPTTSRRPVVSASATTVAAPNPPHPRSSWVCPSPAKYRRASVVLDDDDDDSDGDVDVRNRVTQPSAAEGPVPPGLPDLSAPAAPRGGPPPSRALLRASVTSLESVDLDVDNNNNNDGSETDVPGGADDPAAASSNDTEPENDKQDDDDGVEKLSLTPQRPKVEYDLIPHRTMLPFSKIRPTMGMNLASIDALGAKCRFQDLSGKFQRVWQSYYKDCDAVIFVFRVDPSAPSSQPQSHQQSQQPGRMANGNLGNGSRHRSNNTNHDNNMDDADAAEVRRQAEKLSPRAQLALLAQVRGAVADDVPLLILGHLWDNNNNNNNNEQGGGGGGTDGSTAGAFPGLLARTDTLYSSAELLPHYHNPLQGVFFASATNGRGVRSAMEWLVPLAKRQQRVRQHQPLHR